MWFKASLSKKLASTNHKLGVVLYSQLHRGQEDLGPRLANFINLSKTSGKPGV
jgi:hypothetical protein